MSEAVFLVNHYVTEFFYVTSKWMVNGMHYMIIYEIINMKYKCTFYATKSTFSPAWEIDINFIMFVIVKNKL